MIDHQARAMSGLSLARLEEIEAKLSAPRSQLPSSDKAPRVWAEELKAGRKSRPPAQKHHPDVPR